MAEGAGCEATAPRKARPAAIQAPLPLETNTLARYLADPIRDDLSRKMVFLGGPRQVGKTTLALALLGTNDSRDPAYLNWDSPRVRPGLLRGELPPGESRLVLDEIHKFPRWRNLVKGLYDTEGDRVSFLIAGSARLDHYRKGGDSLQGRYHYYRLHPLTLGELTSDSSPADLDALMQFGGFPEPFLAGNTRTWRRWQHERQSRILYEDLPDLENVREVALVELLAEALPDRVGSPLSIRSLSQDLQVAHETVARWLAILENLFVCFRIPPFGAPRIRAVKKETKLYLWDWSQAQGKGPRFENLVACHLLKYCHLLEDTQAIGWNSDLFGTRTAAKSTLSWYEKTNRSSRWSASQGKGHRVGRSSTSAKEHQSRTSTRSTLASGITSRTELGSSPSRRSVKN